MPSFPRCEECEDVFQGRYDVVDVLGQGSFGIVFQAQRKNDRELRAVKRLDLDSATLPRAAREVTTITSIGRHSGYIFFDEVFWKEHKTGSAGHMYICMELCEQNTLKDWIKGNRTARSRPWMLMKDWIKQLACALDHLHSNNFIHRDLKPENVFFARDSQFKKLKIGDFGLTTRAIEGLKDWKQRTQSQEAGQNHTAGAGTPSYMAPEQIRNQYNEKVDIFALGLIAAELIIINTPSDEMGTNDIIRSGQWPIAWQDYPDAIEFLSQLTHMNPTMRPSAVEVSMHPFVQ
ncbi:Protein kinase domain-containing protein [Caenorhabditis elegans]|uniref:Protein kinase domain-containing protein n=1 Tax=Caenorhabditis elegans TaxID=6239 RepID=Q9NAK3_CAEEL|nr:Protein kinase domain-containing protein [Caenorhabditis elegans]CAB54399.3 Protein kinase domain-containing protein [Caenorhabditis elegans]|eukprot:NP_496691.3 Uncharacterized protein CELE_Y38E10A.8 [Caenorhabditis elegans]